MRRGRIDAREEEKRKFAFGFDLGSERLQARLGHSKERAHGIHRHGNGLD